MKSKYEQSMATYLRLLEDALVSFQNTTEILETWPQELGCILLRSISWPLMLPPKVGK